MESLQNGLQPILKQLYLFLLISMGDELLVSWQCWLSVDTDAWFKRAINACFKKIRLIPKRDISEKMVSVFYYFRPKVELFLNSP